MTSIAKNQDIARRLREVAQLLEDQGANRFRVWAYRAAAETIERLTVPAAVIAEQQGTDGLQSLSGIVVSLARSIHTLVVSGRMPMLDRLRGHMDPDSLLTSIPGIGPSLATRLHNDLHIETLEQLEMAADEPILNRLRPFALSSPVQCQPSESVRSFRLRPSSEHILIVRAPGAKKAPHALVPHLRRPRVARARRIGSAALTFLIRPC